MTFTNSNNNSEGKFSKPFSSSLGSSASISPSGSTASTSTATPARTSTFPQGTNSSLTSSGAKTSSLGTATSAASSFSAGKATAPGTMSTFASSTQTKTVPLTSVSSATAARPAALSPTPTGTTASPTAYAASNTTTARPSAFSSTPQASSLGAGTAGKSSTFTTGSASTLGTTNTSRPAFGGSQPSTAASQTAVRPSAFSATANTAVPRTAFASTATASTTGAARHSAFTSTPASSTAGAFGTRTTAPISNDEFAKKFAETKASLSTARRTPSAGAESNAPAVAPGQEVTDVQYRRFAAFIEEKCGIVLGVGKQYLVNSRLSTLLSKFGISNVDELINKAMENTPNNKIQEAVVDAMTTNETLWFRDTYPYTALEQFILPELAKKAKYPVRIWSAACSSGQEPYSIGIIVQEQMAKMLHIDPKQTQIIGTDLSPEMLNTCKKGQYDVHALSRGLSAERKSKFFKPTRDPNIMQIDPRVKSMVEFRPMNLLGSYALMGKFDVIFCRNVLIYFSNDVKAEILRKLTMCLNPGGYLILGSTETLVGVADKYEMVRHSPGILYRLKPEKFAF